VAGLPQLRDQGRQVARTGGDADLDGRMAIPPVRRMTPVAATNVLSVLSGRSSG
jgi:hypothetical protein